MKKIFERIPYFPWVAVALILWCCLSFFCFRKYYYPALEESSAALLSGFSQDAAEYELTEGKTYTQEVSCNEELEGVMLYLTHYGRGADGSVKVTVFSEDGSQLIQREFMAYEIVEEEPLEIRFPEVLPLAEHVLKIEVEGNATEGRGFFLWTSELQGEKNQVLHLNEEKLAAKLSVGVLRPINTAAVWIYWGIAGLALLTAGLAYWLACFKKVKIHTLFLVVGMGIGLCYLFLFPPSAAPDEGGHFSIAYRFSNIGFGLPVYDAQEKGMWMRECDLDMQMVKSDRFTAEDYRQTWGTLFDRPENTELVIRKANPNPGYATYPILYTFSAFGIFIGRLLGFSLSGLYLLARLFNLTAFVMAVYGAIRWIPFGKRILFGVALLPITMNMMASCNYDVVIFALMFLTIAYWMKMAFSDQPIRIRDMVIGCILNMLLAPAKMVYTVLCGLCLLIPVKKVGGWKRWFMHMAVYLVPAAFMLLLIQMQSLTGYIGAESKTISWAGGVPGYTFGWVLQNIPEYISILVRTALESGSQLMNQMFGMALGRLELYIPYYCVLGYCMLLLVSTFCGKDEPVYMKNGNKAWVLFLTFVFTVWTASGMLVGWTPLGSPVILGLQGRYFIAGLILLLLCMRNRIFVCRGNAERGLCLAFTGWQAFTILFILMQVAG